MISMLWMKIIFIGIIFISQMYVMKFQSSAEGKDERGKEILNKTNSMLFNILFLGVSMLIIFNLIDVVSTTQLPDLLLFLILSLSVFGSVYIYYSKNKANY